MTKAATLKQVPTPLSTLSVSQGMNFLSLLPLSPLLLTHWRKENRLLTKRNLNQIGTRLLPGNDVHKKAVKSHLNDSKLVSIELCWGKQGEGAMSSWELEG